MLSDLRKILAPPRADFLQRIPWRRRLETRVLLGITVVLIIALGGLLFAVQHITTATTFTAAEANFRAAAQAFDALRQDRAERLGTVCRLLAHYGIFKTEFDRRDRPTFTGLCQDLKRQLAVDLFLVRDEEGRELASPDWPEGGPQSESLQSVIDSVLENAAKEQKELWFRGVIDLGGDLYLVAAEPIWFSENEELSGMLIAGMRLGNDYANRLALLSRCEVSFVLGNRVRGTSLGPAQEAALAGAAERGLRGIISDDDPDMIELAGARYLAERFPLPSGALASSTAQLVLLQDWGPAQKTIATFDAALIGLAAVTLLLMLPTGFVVARAMTRPLSEVAAVATYIAGGRWEEQMPNYGGAEVEVMAEAFNRMTENLQHWYEQAIDRTAQVERSYDDTLRALSRALDTRDNDTEGHSQRVTHYAVRIGEQLGMANGALRHLELGALLHDVGKIGIPDGILLKQGSLTDEEAATMRRHVEIGLSIVESIPYLQDASEVIRYHHERFDGRGYPNGLSGEEIPLGARVFSVVDTLDALTSDRPYRRAATFPEAIAEIRRCAGSQFDPKVVEALEALLPELEAWRSTFVSRSLDWPLRKSPQPP
jgi:putative nucleotidyltransferase with HDIG domain